MCLRELTVVAVPDEHDRLPVDLVREERRGGKVTRSIRNGGQVAHGIPVRRDILPDDTRKALLVEGISSPDAGDARREQATLAQSVDVDIDPALILHDGDFEMIRRIELRADVH